MSYEKLTMEENGIFDGVGKRKNFSIESRYDEIKKGIQGGFLNNH